MSIGMSPTNNASSGAQCVASSVCSTCCACGLRAPATSGPTIARKNEARPRNSRILREKAVGLFEFLGLASFFRAIEAQEFEDLAGKGGGLVRAHGHFNIE